jgi:hypothetical protein
MYRNGRSLESSVHEYVVSVKVVLKATPRTGETLKYPPLGGLFITMSTEAVETSSLLYDACSWKEYTAPPDKLFPAIASWNVDTPEDNVRDNGVNEIFASCDAGNSFDDHCTTQDLVEVTVPLTSILLDGLYFPSTLLRETRGAE